MNRSYVQFFIDQFQRFNFFLPGIVYLNFSQPPQKETAATEEGDGFSSTVPAPSETMPEEILDDDKEAAKKTGMFDLKKDNAMIFKTVFARSLFDPKSGTFPKPVNLTT